MKWFNIILLVVLLMLQYRLWVGEGSLAEVHALGKKLEIQEQENRIMRERNDLLQAEVVELKSGLESIEARARSELGMIKKGETFYMLIEDKGAE